MLQSFIVLICQIVPGYKYKNIIYNICNYINIKTVLTGRQLLWAGIAAWHVPHFLSTGPTSHCIQKFIPKRDLRRVPPNFPPEPSS